MRFDGLEEARGISTLRRFLPLAIPRRSDAVLFFQLDVPHGPAAAFLDAHAVDDPAEPLSLFHLVLAACLRTLVERPQLNRTVLNGRLLEREALSLTFSVKKGKRDGARIVPTKVDFEPTDTLWEVRRKVNAAVRTSRDPAAESASERELDAVLRLPRPLARGILGVVSRLDARGWLPRRVFANDPRRTSAFVGNLGSIGLDASFHHLSDEGTASIHMTLGKVKPTVVAEAGEPVVRDAFTLRVAIDDRIVDGFYCAGSLKRLEHWLTHPEALAQPWPTRTDLPVARLWKRALETPEAPAYWLRSSTEDDWFPTTWSSLLTEVRAIGQALIAYGVQPGDRVCIQGSNRPEWTVTYLASQAIGAIPCGLHEDLDPDAFARSLQVARPRFVLLETDGVRSAARAALESLVPDVRIGTMLREGPDNWADLLERGAALDDGSVERRLTAIDAGQPGVAVFTSGTSGQPRAALLSHRSLLWTAETAIRTLGIGPNETTVSYLPLSHVAEQNFTIVAALVAGGSVAYAPSRGGVVDTLREFRPTVFFGVPTIWERVRRQVEGDDLASVGLDRVRVAVSGAGALPADLYSWFADRGLELLQTYGQTEGCGPTTLTAPGQARPGTCGPALPGVDLKLVDVEDGVGEVWFRGPNAFLGYLDDPEETERVRVDGWIRTGDRARCDDGHLRIVGRARAILVPRTGENVAPEAVEASLERADIVERALVLGDDRPHLVALLTLDVEVAVGLLDAAGVGVVSDVRHHPVVRRAVREAVERHNARCPRAHRIVRHAVLPRPLSVEDGELTPTLKLRRPVVARRWAGLVEALYQPGRRWSAPSARTPSGFVAAPAGPERYDALFALRHTVFSRAGHLAPGHYLDGRLRDAFDAHAVQFALDDAEGRLAGTARLVPATEGLPVEALFDFEGLGVPRHSLGEVGRLAIAPRWRARRAPIVTLVHAALDHALALGMTHVYAFVPARAVRGYAALGLPVWELPLRPVSAATRAARAGMAPYFAQQDPRVVVFTDPGALCDRDVVEVA
jgi:long-chain acyl-CoA synthetase